MKKEKYLILEFDDTRVAKIEPTFAHKKIEGYEYCVITIFREVLENMEKKGLIRVVKFLNCETMDIPIYEMEYMGGKGLRIPGIPGLGWFSRIPEGVDRQWVQ